MKRFCWSISLVLTTIWLPNILIADLTNPTYLEAKKYYNNGNCERAVELLIKYKEEDSIFLSANKDILSLIDKAIEYCMRGSSGVKISEGFKVAGIKLKKSDKPTLP